MGKILTPPFFQTFRKKSQVEHVFVFPMNFHFFVSDEFHLKREMSIAMDNSLESSFIEIILPNKEIFFLDAYEAFLSPFIEEISKEINFIF